MRASWRYLLGSDLCNVRSISLDRPYGIPKRDEEAETQRKARAKRARETRRSTQVSGDVHFGARSGIDYRVLLIDDVAF
jgi:hypothetical protein